MSPKVTLYVRDEQLWNRARKAAGKRPLSEVVTEALREWLERQSNVPDPSAVERAKRVLAEAEALLESVEKTTLRPRGTRPGAKDLKK